MAENPHFIARKFQEIQRQSARPFVCPVCAVAAFPSEIKLFEHVTAAHAADTPRSRESPAWKDFVAKAQITKAKQKNNRRLAPENVAAVSKRLSNDSMGPNLGDESVSRSRASSRPVSASVPSRTPEKSIDDMRKLSINQTQNLDPIGSSNPAENKKSPISIASNPLKRTVAETGQTEHSSRKAKALSGGFIPKDPDFDRKPPPNKRLFDPHTDRTSGPRKAGFGDAPIGPRRADPRPQPHRAKRDLLDSHDTKGFTRTHQHHPVVVDNSPGGHDVPSSDGASNQSQSRNDDDQESEYDQDPELLLQPETRPISHEQLVVEVKGIYAGLVMVEAKCIDVDEKQSIAAQERDPSKQTTLAPEQWQALIALHKTLLHEHHDFFLASQHPSASPALSHKNLGNFIPTYKISKVKRGLAGYLNGSRTSAFPDTGSRRNIISEAYAKDMKLKIEGSSSKFKLGNSRTTKSLGIVRVKWAFSETPNNILEVICDVLPECTYDFILGNPFLIATQTLSKFTHRLTQCLFSITSAFPLRLALLGDTSQRFECVLGDRQPILVVLDTGAERNVMNKRYAIKHGFYIKQGPSHENFLEFADGTYQKTVGQVFTSFTFPTGKKIPVTFEILENCISEVIIGEEIIYGNDIFRSHASFVKTFKPESELYELAPFSFIEKNWQQFCDKVTNRVKSKSSNATSQLPESAWDSAFSTEDQRREAWNFSTEFGRKTSEDERRAEEQRRKQYKEAEVAWRRRQQTNNTQLPPPKQAVSPTLQRKLHRIPSIPTSPDRPPESFHPARVGLRTRQG